MTTLAGSSPKAKQDRAPQTTGRNLLIWMDGKLVPEKEARVSVFDHGLLYGDGVFEGIRVYNGRIFKFGSHLDRLFRSAEKIELKPAFTREVIDKATRETVEANGLTDAYIRLVLTRGYGDLGLNPFLCPTSGTIIIADRIQLYPPEFYEKGIAVVVAKRPRQAVQCLDPSVKSLNYLNNIMAKVEAIRDGVLEAIMLNLEGNVAECTGDNLFIIKDGKVSTPPVSAGILNGITRQFVISDIAPALGLEVVERDFRIDEVFEADEVFLTGTAAEVIGVTKVDDTVKSGGTVGPITAKLTAEFKRLVAKDAPED